MNVFEKIKEKLGKQMQVQKYLFNNAKLEYNEKEMHIHKYASECYEYAMCIVDEVAQEYNNGWIPCSERLPNGNKYCLVTYQTDNKIWVDAWVFNGVDFNEVGETKVIAWQPLPAPYKEGGTE